MLHVLEKNYTILLGKVIKSALHHRFKAVDIDVPLYLLVAAIYLQEDWWREFINPYYEAGSHTF